MWSSQLDVRPSTHGASSMGFSLADIRHAEKNQVAKKTRVHGEIFFSVGSRRFTFAISRRCEEFLKG